MPLPVHFEIFADDPERAITFYTTVFGWTIEESGGERYWLINTDESAEEPGITGGLTERLDPLDSTVVTFAVPSLDGFVKRIATAGGKIVTPKLTIPGIGYSQYCRDSEGNLFSIIQYDEKA
jgi:predicted enzyme related to lactoylglutathione lyase